VVQYKQGAFFSYEFVGENSWNGYERKCLFANVGDGQFVDVARPTGSDSIKDGRGVAVADYNGDGKLDLIINNNNAAPTIYLNALKNVGRCIEMKLVGTSSNRDAVGARVRLGVAGKTLTRQVEAGSGYASEAMLPVHFGLGNAARIESVEITWPDGSVQRFMGSRFDPFIDRMVQIEEGNDQLFEFTPGHAPPHELASMSNAKRLLGRTSLQ
jgi:hypothetical protein